MTDETANDLRLYAASYVHRLYEAGQVRQLHLLLEQVKRDIAVLEFRAPREPAEAMEAVV